MTIKEIILTNDGDKNLKQILSDFSDNADCIKIATAFFSDTAFIINWLNESKQIDLLISLRPPTNYYSLKNVQSKPGINIQFLGNDFHSKFFVFYKKNNPFAAIIGSSNFTAGGLNKNIETNAILTDVRYLKELNAQFSKLWDQSFTLQPTDLDAFKLIFDHFQKRQDQTEKEQKEFQKKILAKRASRKAKLTIGKEAKQYLSFWRVVDDVKEMVDKISQEEYPNIPVYITIDHFWHWIKIVWAKTKQPKPTLTDRQIVIPRLFKEFCHWDKAMGNHTIGMAKISKTIFSKLLSKNNIDKLTKDQAQKIYANLHSGAMRTRRFGADKKFVKENPIQKIRSSLKYLLYSNDDIDLRIHNLCINSDYKLSQLKSSGTQELIGWVTPNKYPMRNYKADDALKLLGL